MTDQERIEALEELVFWQAQYSALKDLRDTMNPMKWKAKAEECRCEMADLHTSLGLY